MVDCACTALKKSVRMHGTLLANTTGFTEEDAGLLNKEDVLTEGYSGELADNTFVQDKQKKLQEYGIDCVEYCYTIECGLKYLQMVGKQRNRYKI
ncbi:NifB-domain protein, type 2 [Methanosarcina siciliae HI350]|uniref:NifB-domain protein, type 2 n=1 Tax=Methanosarcina siciliae HI350 TaxID=1434119 RepID=A0A0E3PGN9_9EURY|nr:hypothetical protein [Methanosarcina siciliae]AKB33582.1 NifB-domain protein, type 2 [Methanosarcina siciliae HI350]